MTSTTGVDIRLRLLLGRNDRGREAPASPSSERTAVETAAEGIEEAARVDSGRAGSETETRTGGWTACGAAVRSSTYPSQFHKIRSAEGALSFPSGVPARQWRGSGSTRPYSGAMHFSFPMFRDASSTLSPPTLRWPVVIHTARRPNTH